MGTSCRITGIIATIIVGPKSSGEYSLGGVHNLGNDLGALLGLGS